MNKNTYQSLRLIVLSTLALSMSAKSADSFSLAQYANSQPIPTSQAAQPAQEKNIKQLRTRPNLSTSSDYQEVADSSRMFGAQLFRGAFSTSSGSSFNQSYIIQKGDNIQLRMWGAYNFAATLTVDPQGNIFIPNVGPVTIAGTRNGSMQNVIKSRVRQVYRANVGVYAALEQAQPVKVFVTGFVNQPGYYGGIAADSVLSYLDRAGGVNPASGSYVDIDIRRNGRTVQKVNLYDFLLAGRLKPFAFKDGDIIVVAPRKHTFSVEGQVLNPYDFEFDVPNLTVQRALRVARPKPEATHFSINRMQGTERRTEYYPLAMASRIRLQDGDHLNVTSDRFEGTIQVRVEGAHSGEHALVLPYGARLSQVVDQLRPNQLSDIANLQLFRKSVAKRQKEMLNVSLDKLEETAYAANSTTKEEATLRKLDAELISKFIEKARKITPKGQVVILPDVWRDVILEQDDVIIIPEISSVVMVHGEVMFPNALSYSSELSVSDYIDQVGGYTADSDKSKVIIIRANGEAEVADNASQLQRGDEIMVLPKIQTKRVEVARGLSQIVYQLAVAAKVILDL